MKKVIQTILLALAGLIYAGVFFLSPGNASLRSTALMSVLSLRELSCSVQHDAEMDVNLPLVSGWQPLIMCYNADDTFSSWIDTKGARLTVLYDFPSFGPLSGCSKLFNENSPYYNGFYGAYVISMPDGGSYGFEPEDDLEEKLSSLAQMDFFRLVLDDFGLSHSDCVFEYAPVGGGEKISVGDFDDWVLLRAQIRVNGAAHSPKDFSRSYLQYGVPNYRVSEDFATVDMYSAVIARFFPQRGVTVIFYVMAADEGVFETCLQRIASESNIMLYPALR